MASVDSELESGEHVLFRTGSHPFAFSGAAMMALFVALVVTLLIRHNDLPRGTEVRIALSGLLVALVGAIPSALRWRNTTLAVTDRRILATAGGLRRRALAVPLGTPGRPSRLGSRLSGAPGSRLARAGTATSIRLRMATGDHGRRGPPGGGIDPLPRRQASFF
jgi:hypothetical protein